MRSVPASSSALSQRLRPTDIWHVGSPEHLLRPHLDTGVSPPPGKFSCSAPPAAPGEEGGDGLDAMANVCARAVYMLFVMNMSFVQFDRR